MTAEKSFSTGDKRKMNIEDNPKPKTVLQKKQKLNKHLNKRSQV